MSAGQEIGHDIIHVLPMMSKPSNVIILRSKVKGHSSVCAMHSNPNCIAPGPAYVATLMTLRPFGTAWMPSYMYELMVQRHC